MPLRSASRGPRHRSHPPCVPRAGTRWAPLGTPMASQRSLLSTGGSSSASGSKQRLRPAPQPPPLFHMAHRAPTCRTTKFRRIAIINHRCACAGSTTGGASFPEPTTAGSGALELRSLGKAHVSPIKPGVPTARPAELALAVPRRHWRLVRRLGRSRLVELLRQGAARHAARGGGARRVAGVHLAAGDGRYACPLFVRWDGLAGATSSLRCDRRQGTTTPGSEAAPPHRDCLSMRLWLMPQFLH